MTSGAGWRGRTIAAALVLLVLVAGVPSGQDGGLTAGPRIAAAYDGIFDARFAELPDRLRDTCPPAPAEACLLLEAVGLWWQINVDPNDLSRDDAFHAAADKAVSAIRAWTRREPERAEAWFYLGGAYGARAQWRVLRGSRLDAARDGTRIKDALERALMLDPMLVDAYFGIGLYHYYADVAPAAVKFLRWLLLLPGGDRAQGLEEMLRARGGGQLLRDEADYQMHLLYLWYEKQPERALELLRALRERHPVNPHFLQRIAEVQDVYLHDAKASLASWQALLEAAEAQRVALPAMAETYARLGIALQLDRLNETVAALPHLRAVIAARPDAPHGAVALAQLRLGEALDRVGTRADADAAYRAAIADAPDHDPTNIASRARAALRRR
jgi:tetratricopeptide (TPR) repeat protein